MTYSSMGGFLGLSNSFSFTVAPLTIGPLGFGGTLSYSWNDQGHGWAMGPAGGIGPRVSAEGATTNTYIYGCSAGGNG